MPSPFPGVDPYLEEHWGDLHTSLSVYARNQLQKVLPPDLVARVEERLVVADPEDLIESIRPDLHVREEPYSKRKLQPVRSSSSLAVVEPVVIELYNEPETQRFIEIRKKDSPGNIVTTIELLSPTNKRPGSKAFRDYRLKQESCLGADINLVEIDLIRAGGWVISVPLRFVRKEQFTPYRVVVRRAWPRFRAELYPIAFQQKLPTIKIPLRETDDDVPLDLQPLIEQCYEDGRYDSIDYDKEPETPLEPADAKWAAQLLRKAALRGGRKRKQDCPV